MAQRFEIVLNPIGGTVVKPNPSDRTLLTPLDQSGMNLLTMDVGGWNWDNVSTTGETAKCVGHAKWSASAVTTGDKWQNWFLLDDGRRRRICGIYNGLFYYFRDDGAGNAVTGSPPVTFTKTTPVSMAQYGDYVLISSLDADVYKWRIGFANLTKLIMTGQQYRFKFIETFHNHVIGAYSDQAAGNIDIRYTDALPSFYTLEFPVTNQLFKPDTDIGITGLKRMGDNACLIYGVKSIHSLDYTPDYSPAFSINPQATGLGTSAPWSIVDLGKSHMFFDPDKGFVEYAGGKNFVPISDDIEPLIATILRDCHEMIYGRYMPTGEIVWAVPLDGANIPTALLYYNPKTKGWRRENRTVSSFIPNRHWDKYPWSSFFTALGSPTALWSAMGTKKWSEYFTQLNDIIFGNTTGYAYYTTGTNMDGADFTAYRIEPIIFAPSTYRSKRLQEIHIVSPASAAYSVDFYWRGGINQQAVNAASWTSLGSISLASTADPVLYCDQDAIFHQLKWGTDLKAEQFRVSQIILKGVQY